MPARLRPDPVGAPCGRDRTPFANVKFKGVKLLINPKQNPDVKLVQVTLRFLPEDAARLSDQAHAARVPMAVLCRELVLGRVPKKAPPLPAEMSYEASQLLKICHACVSNLSQLDGHCAATDSPISKLSGPAGHLQMLSSRARKLGLQIKAGQAEPAQFSTILSALEGPALALNERLARPINEGQVPTNETWREVLQALQTALPEA